MRKLTKTAAVVASMAVMAMGTAVMTSATQEGWVQSGSNWYFYVNGNAVENQWALAGEKWYFLGDDGKMVKDAFINDNEEVENISDLPEGGDTDDPVYFVGSDGAMITGWKRIDVANYGDGAATPKDSNKWYYFGGTGMMFGEQWVESNGKWYYLGTNGRMVKNDWDEDSDYYLGDDGICVTGWYKLSEDDDDLGEDGDWIYADDDDLIENEWKKIDGKWYYFGNKGIKRCETVSGSAAEVKDSGYTMNEEVAIKKGDSWFYLKKNGAMETGWFSVKTDEKKGKDSYKYYAKSNGEIQCFDNIKEVNGKNYFFYNGDCSTTYAGEYLDEDYIVTCKVKEGKDTVEKVLRKNETLSSETEVETFGSRNEAQKAAEEADIILPGSYKIYKLGSGTTYTETKKAK